MAASFLKENFYNAKGEIKVDENTFRWYTVENKRKIFFSKVAVNLI